MDGHPPRRAPACRGRWSTPLLARIHREAGDAGVAQALAMADEERPFATLGDAATWTGLADAAALFAAGALVTGDGAIGLHVGEDLLWTGDDPVADRLALLDGPEDAARHIGAVIEGLEGATEAVALEAGRGHALVQVSTTDGVRQAHLCELI